MLRAIFFVIKLVAFSALVLVLGNLIRWDGRTVSDQIRTRLAHAERSELTTEVRDWAGNLVSDARQGARKKQAAPALSGRGNSESDSITSSERQKLRALIRELNSSR
jgi:hypothetical protein